VIGHGRFVGCSAEGDRTDVAEQRDVEGDAGGRAEGMELRYRMFDLADRSTARRGGRPPISSSALLVDANR
jgi:hypothetical protein